MRCDTDGPPLRTTGCARGGGVLLRVSGMACLECGKMLCKITVIIKMSAALSSDAFRLKRKEKKKRLIKPKTGITFLELSGIENFIITSGWQCILRHWVNDLGSRQNAI